MTEAATKRKPTPGKGLMAVVNVSSQLAMIVGTAPLTHLDVTKKVWAYIKEHKLQSIKDGRIVEPDKLLGDVLGTTEPIHMTQMNKAINQHVMKPV